MKSNEDLASEVWALIHSGLVKDGVKFPNNFDGIGAAYGGCARLIEAFEDKDKEREEAVAEAYKRGYIQGGFDSEMNRLNVTPPTNQ
jgi:hypothetical protein